VSVAEFPEQMVVLPVIFAMGKEFTVTAAELELEQPLVVPVTE
jgi:hypothetical protein